LEKGIQSLNIGGGSQDQEVNVAAPVSY